MPLTAQQARFVERFLGIAKLQTGVKQVDPAAALQYWRDGKEQADQSITALQSSLKKFGHPDLDRIAEFGMHGFSAQQQTKMMAALMSYAQAAESDRAKAAQAVSEQVDSYRAFLSTNDLIRLSEANPFGISVDIRGPLNAALDRIERALAA